MTNTEKNNKNQPSDVRKPLANIPQLPAYRLVNSVPNSPALMRNTAIVSSSKNSPQLNHVINVDNLVCPPSPSPSLNIIRPVFNVKEFNENFLPNETHKTTKDKIKKFKPDFSKKAWINRIKKFFPIIGWLSNYDIKQNLIADIIVGITIASFQVPQSMGYALIAHVNPVYGLYTAFFPALMYTIFGTSRHSSVGPVAVVAGLMTGNIVIDVSKDLGLRYQDGNTVRINGTEGGPLAVVAGFEDIKNIDIAIMVAIIDGIYILVFGILRLGFISNYLSEEMVSGFMTSAAIHVFTTQVHYLFGLHLSNHSGPFALPNTYIEFFEKIKEVNLTALTISLICIAILIFFKFFVEKMFHKMGLKMPFPIHLFIMIGGCIASYLLDAEENYQVQVVGIIPNKFAMPAVPKFKLFGYMWFRCIPTAVVTYTQTLSIGRLYGAKHNYNIDANQEMLAIGISNIWGSFFSTLPCSASIPRSAVQEQGGGRTQIVSLVNCVCILFVILLLSELLQDLPNCVLAACIAVALVSIISKFQEFINFIKISKLDGGIWLVTFLGVIVLNVDYGIYIGFGCSLLLLIYKSQRPKTYSLGSVDNSDIYVPISKFIRAKELVGVKIYQFCGPLNFANVEYFKKELQIRSGVDVRSIKEEMSKINPKPRCFIFGESNSSTKTKDVVLKSQKNLPKYIIIDCSMLSYIDTSGVTALKKLVQTHADISVEILLTGCPVHIETTLNRDGFFKEISEELVYKSVHDAITFIRDVDPHIGRPVVNRNNNLSKAISKSSLDSFDSNTDNINYKIFDTQKSLFSRSPNGSPQLTDIRSIRSITFSNS